MPGKKLDNELLNKMVEEYNVQLLEDYEKVKISGQSMIYFMCTSEGCVENVERYFKNIIKYEGKFMCKYCIAKKKVDNIDKTKEKLKYDFQLLETLCKENEVSLVEDYSKQKISGKSEIKLNCKKCLNPFEKNFTKLIQNKIFLCKKCVNEKRIIERKDTIQKRLKDGYLDEENNVVYYNLTLLNKLIKDLNITLLESYDNSINRDTVIKGKCINKDCINDVNKKLIYIYQYNNFHCTKCIKELSKERMEKTFLKNYGVSNPFKNKEIREKIEKTIFLKYGVKHVMHNKNFLDILKEKKFKKYGVYHIMHVKEIVNKMKENNLKKYGTTSTLYAPGVREKIHKTWIQKYGTIDYRQTELYKNNFSDAIQKKYGVNTVLRLKSVRDKIKQTNIMKYGVDNPTKNKSIYQKVVNTFKKRYNVVNTSQHKLFFSKALKTLYSKKSYKMPSGKIIDVQGYEPFALNILLNQNIEEDDIITDREEVPELWYSYREDTYEHRHFVDIYIKSQNRCIEVKSIYTFIKDKEKVLIKQEYAKKDGYLYEIWVLGRDGNIIEKII